MMLDFLMQASLRNRLIVLLGALAIFAAGTYVTLESPIDVFVNAARDIVKEREKRRTFL